MWNFPTCAGVASVQSGQFHRRLVFPDHVENLAHTKSNRLSEEFPPTSAFALKIVYVYSKGSHQFIKLTAEQNNEKEKMSMAFSIEERTLIELYSDLGSSSCEKVMQNIEHNLPAIEDFELVDQLTILLHKLSALTDSDFRKIDFTDIIGY